MIIAIDGPAGAGKSTAARMVAETLGYTYLDTGAMYRAVAFVLIERGGTALLERSDIAAAVAGQVEVTEPGRVVIEGRDLTECIRTAEIAEATPHIAKAPAVRAALVTRQRNLIAHGDWVVEGRDIGTVVAPDAEVKIFLTANPRERARRRAIELGVDPESVLSELLLRDQRDATREHSPLKPAPSALTIDATDLTLDQVVERITELARAAEIAA
jgi:cytidylate kinase